MAPNNTSITNLLTYLVDESDMVENLERGSYLCEERRGRRRVITYY